MLRSRKSRRIAVATLIASVLALTGCSKITEPYNDAPVSGNNDEPALRVSFPDGFSNVATKCDGPNRVYVAYHGDAAYGAVAVAPNDPRCAN